jgi:hypothetical protein
MHIVITYIYRVLQLGDKMGKRKCPSELVGEGIPTIRRLMRFVGGLVMNGEYGRSWRPLFV